MTDQIVLYDAPSKAPRRCFSPNTWKVRTILNYKNLPYRTEWLEFPDVRPTLKSLGIPPNDPSEHFDFSVPAMKFPDGTYAMESTKVAHALEKYQPSPSLHLDTDYAKRAQEIVNGFLYSISVAYVYRIPEMLLTPETAEWYHEARTKLIGASLYDLRDGPGTGGEAAWKKAEPSFEALKVLLAENPEGPYVMGEQVSYADFVLLGWWKICGKLDQDGDLHGRVMKVDERFREHEKACEKFCVRDD